VVVVDVVVVVLDWASLTTKASGTPICLERIGSLGKSDKFVKPVT
jgi:hypothetical protein